MRRGAKPPYRHSSACRRRLDKAIQKDVRARWERYEIRRPAGDPARSSPVESSDKEGEAEEHTAPPDDYGFPMISPLVERLLKIDVTEMFSPPRVTTQAKRFGLKTGEACDLSTGWDFRLQSHRDAAIKHVRDEKPLVVIGSPPCTPFSQLQTLNPDTAEKRARLKEGEEHMRLMVEIYRMHIEEGCIFLHEHPAHARSWHMNEVSKLMKEQGITLVEADQCMFGLKTW